MKTKIRINLIERRQASSFLEIYHPTDDIKDFLLFSINNVSESAEECKLARLAGAKIQKLSEKYIVVCFFGEYKKFVDLFNKKFNFSIDN